MSQRFFFSAVLRSFQSGLRRALALGVATLAFLVVPNASAQEISALATIQHNGILSVALYNDFAPFSNNGKGIDVDLAHALAAKLGVKATPVWFNAGDDVDGDLRKMVWKGTQIN